MSAVVLDSSAVIAFALQERGWEIVAAVVRGGLIATPNIAEVAQRFARAGFAADHAARLIRELGTVAVAPDVPLAIEAGTMMALTRKRGLSLADCFCLALARREAAVALTADRAWADVADTLGVRVELVR